MVRSSDLFAHQLIWALKTEEQPPQEAFNPEVKRWVPAHISLVTQHTAHSTQEAFNLRIK